jgi:hypothetical protein
VSKTPLPGQSGGGYSVVNLERQTEERARRSHLHFTDPLSRKDLAWSNAVVNFAATREI